ncbi:MAG: hypothetical protein PHX83_06355 [Acidobacteriia bacterium]|nr:hypothetical protein [Terriglobia bacterium]
MKVRKGVVAFFVFCVLSVPLPVFSKSKNPKPPVQPSGERVFVDESYPVTSIRSQRREQDMSYRRLGPHVSFKRDALNADMGNIAVIEDNGLIVFPINSYDFDHSNILYTPNGSTYLVSKIAPNFDVATGSTIVPGSFPAAPSLGDDDATQVSFAPGFTFTFFGQTYNNVWVGSDGHLTFTGPDATSDDRDIVRFLNLQPRIAPFFTDLLPPCGGSVSTLQKSDRFIVLYSDVSRFQDVCTASNRDHYTFEVILHANGAIEFSYNGISSPAGGADSTTAVVGIAPGNNQGIPPANVDYTHLTSPTNESGAIFEFFTLNQVFSDKELARAFYQTHGDDYNFITVFANFPVNLGNAFAFEINVRNSVRGLGSLGIFDDSNFSFGSPAKLESYLNMGSLGNFPLDPNTPHFLGTNSPVEVMGQEFGHRWMAFDDIPEAVCNDPSFSNSILGRQCAHWSYFFNSKGSVMEGNALTDNLNGTFTVNTSQNTSHYSDFDQYLMGLLPPSQVQDSFAVFNPSGTGKVNSSAPDTNSPTFQGTRHNVSINDIITANGTRNPSSASSPHSFRQAWVLLVQKGTTPSAGDLSKIDTFRQGWQSFFSTATGGLGSVDTTLIPAALTQSLPASTGFSRTSTGAGTLSVSYGQVGSTTLSDPVTLAIFALTQNNVLVTEAGIPASGTTTSARIFVDYDQASGKNSGVALVNAGGNPITVNVLLTTMDGATSSACSSQPIAGHGHIALFVNQLGCAGLTSPFLGTITFSSVSPFAAVNLRTANNTHGEQIFSALPVADLTVTPSSSGSLVFSQIVDGGGTPTQILLMNTTGSLISGTISFADDNGNAISLDFGSPLGVRSSLTYSIPANGMVKFSTTGLGSLKVAYALVVSTSGALPSGAAVFASNNSSGGLASQAGVLNAPKTTSARVYIERDSSPLVRDTGVAVVNANGPSTPATVTFNVVSFDGSYNQTTTANLPANGHLAKFIEQIFASASPPVPADFQGVLNITSNVPISPVTLRLTVNQRGDNLFSTLPVADLNNPPVPNGIIPQIVNGGGFTTQIISINTTSSSGTVAISFLNDSGQQVLVPFN